MTNSLPTFQQFGIVKTYFIQSILGETHEQRKKVMEQMIALLAKHLVPIRPNRTVKQKPTVTRIRLRQP